MSGYCLRNVIMVSVRIGLKEYVTPIFSVPGPHVRDVGYTRQALVGVLEREPGIGKHLAPCLGEGYTVAVTYEKHSAQLPLQLLHLLGERALGHAHQLGGLRETERLGHAHEIFELA